MSRRTIGGSPGPGQEVIDVWIVVGVNSDDETAYEVGVDDTEAEERFENHFDRKPSRYIKVQLRVPPTEKVVHELTGIVTEGISHAALVGGEAKAFN